MKKNIIAAVMISSLLLTACGEVTGDTAETSAAEQTSETTSAAADTETSAEETSETTEETTESETEEVTESEAPDETEADESDSESADGEKTYEGDIYTLKYDESKWMSAIDYMDMEAVGQEVADTIGSDRFSSDDIAAMYSGVVICLDDPQVSFNVVLQDFGYDLLEMGVDLDMLEQATASQYAQVESYRFVGSEMTTVNGHDAVRLEVESDLEDGTVMKGTQFAFIIGSYEAVISYTAASDKYDTYYLEFEKVLNTLEFTSAE